MDNLTVKSFELRKNVVDMIVAGKGGHIGGDMSVIDTLITLYYNIMNVGPDMQDDPDGEMFIMSKGCSVEALYAEICL